MADLYRLYVHFPMVLDGREPIDLQAEVLSHLHEAVIVEEARSGWRDSVAVVEADILLAGQGEADDTERRVQNAPGLPARDVFVRLLKRDA